VTTGHGTANYYTQGCHCALCRKAWAKEQQRQRQRLANLPIPEHLHGRYSTYVNRGCRCDQCTRAAAAYKRAYKQKVKR
jgi:hypothetical protein